GKYEIRTEVGGGGEARVYEGWDPAIARRVAIKTVRIPYGDDPELRDALARFRQSAMAAGRLNHPNIVCVFDYGEVDGFAYIVMEFVEGRSLEQRLKEGARLSLNETTSLMQEVLAALAYSHQQGVVHRDVKSGNVMLSNDGHVKLTDFGIARIDSSRLTQAGTIMGTPAYMSPEQFIGQPADARSDIYSAGVVLYQLLTGERPFEGSFTTIMHKVLHTRPLKPSELSVTVPSPFDAVVERAMALRPADRFQSAREFAEGLRGAETQSLEPKHKEALPSAPADATVIAPSKAATPSGSAPSRDRSRLRAGGIAAALLIIIVLAGIGVWWALPGSNNPRITSTGNREAGSAQRVAATIGRPSTGTGAVSEAKRAEIASEANTSSSGISPPNTPSPDSEPSRSESVRATEPAAKTAARPSLPPAEPERLALTPKPPRPEPIKGTAPPLKSDAQPPLAAAKPERLVLTPKPPSSEPVKAMEPSAQPDAPAPTPPVKTEHLALASPKVPNPAELRRQLASALAAIPCTLASADVSEPSGIVLVRGLTGAGDAEASLKEAVKKAAPDHEPDWKVRSFNKPLFCRVLDEIHPITARWPGDPGSDFSIGLAGQRAHLQTNDVIELRIHTPPEPSWLQIFYLQSNGKVTEIFPAPGEPGRLFPANSDVAIGRPHDAFPGWYVDKPYGTEMMIAIASQSPLFAGGAPNDEEAATYLDRLSSAIAQARTHGEHLYGDALVLETSARR
ncbi:MAG: protein kinase, partial [Acetobacteraceae bacterium]|nr:protein kinase [Acetobacteraceae bacterium]